jgi:hypothetical protein
MRSVAERSEHHEQIRRRRDVCSGKITRRSLAQQTDNKILSLHGDRVSYSLDPPPSWKGARLIIARQKSCKASENCRNHSFELGKGIAHASAHFVNALCFWANENS